MTAGSTTYAATRLTYDIAASYAETRARFEELDERIRTVVEDCCR
jgi:hypothetical protein